MTTPAADDLLADAWQILAAFHPELSDYLRGASVEELEQPAGCALRMFKECGATALTAPKSLGGLGASAEQMAHVYRAIGSRAPSLAVASSFHHASVATLIDATLSGPEHQIEAVQFVITAGALVTSGFVEGIPGDDRTLPTTTQAIADLDTYILNGYVRPCSMARSMDLVLCSAEIDGHGRALALIPAGSPGLTLRRFWESPLLRATETAEIVLTDVAVPTMLAVGATTGIERAGRLWSGVLVAAAYLGMATALMQRVLDGPRREPAAFMAAASAVESAWSAVLFICRELDAGKRDVALAVRILHLRYALRDNLAGIATHLIEAMGEPEFGGNFEMPYLAGCLHALALHLPSRRSIAAQLYDFQRGRTLEQPR